MTSTREALRQRDDGRLSRPGTRERMRDTNSTHERRSSDESTGEQRVESWKLRPGESFQMDMPSFRMTWSSGGFSILWIPIRSRTSGTASEVSRGSGQRPAIFCLGKTLVCAQSHAGIAAATWCVGKSRVFDLACGQAQIWAQEGAPGGEELRQVPAHIISVHVCERSQPRSRW